MDSIFEAVCYDKIAAKGRGGDSGMEWRVNADLPNIKGFILDYQNLGEHQHLNNIGRQKSIYLRRLISVSPDRLSKLRLRYGVPSSLVSLAHLR